MMSIATKDNIGILILNQNKLDIQINNCSIFVEVSKGILVTHPTKHHYSDVATWGPYELIQMNWPSLHSEKTEPGTHNRTTCYTNMFAAYAAY